MLAIAALLFHVLGFLSSIDAVMSTRTSQGAIAWAVVLNTFPYVAVPAYWILGRSKFQGYVTARQEGDFEIRGLTEQVKTYEEQFVSGAGAKARRHGQPSVWQRYRRSQGIEQSC